MKQGSAFSKSCFDYFEEAFYILRNLPLVHLLVYYAGTFPFAALLVYFCTEMSLGTFASTRCADLSLILALSYLWMKCFQCVFMVKVREWLENQPSSKWTPSRIFHMAVSQASIQSTSLILLPISIIISLPYAWVNSFYHNVTLYGDGTSRDMGSVYRRSRDIALLWPKENNLIAAFLILFGFIVFFNLVALYTFLPELLKSLLGLESMLTLSGGNLVNTTFFMLVFMSTFLIVNPLSRVVHLLRCYYGESLHSGEDIKVELNRIRLKKVLSLLVGLLVLVMPSHATETSEQATTTAVTPVRLDSAIEKVVRQEKYTWRLPRQPLRETEKGVIAAFFDSIKETLAKWARAVIQAIADAYESVQKSVRWLLKKLGFEDQKGAGSGEKGRLDAFEFWVRLLVTILLAVIIIALLILGWRVLKNRRRRVDAAIALPVLQVPDLADENISASQLPEDTWLQLARECLQKGDLRLAIRAFFLASLAHLGQRELLTIAKFKSNRDYLMELQRRTRQKAELFQAFRENVQLFEQVWYGRHEANAQLLNHFTSNLERIKSAG